jgi:Cytosol aminopeptidase family, N-terminal domain
MSYALMPHKLLAVMALAVSVLAQTRPAIDVLVQSPAETNTDLQIICLFRSSPINTLHGSLDELNTRLKGQLDRIRKPDLFRGELGETVLLTPLKGSLDARKLLIIGLGDSQTFSPQRMQLVGEIVYTEAARIGVPHPFFAPTILDGGVTRFGTGEVAEQVIRGFLQAAATEKLANGVQSVNALTFLAGQAHADDTRAGIAKALSNR